MKVILRREWKNIPITIVIHMISFVLSINVSEYLFDEIDSLVEIFVLFLFMIFFLLLLFYVVFLMSEKYDLTFCKDALLISNEKTVHKYPVNDIERIEVSDNYKVGYIYMILKSGKKIELKLVDTFFLNQNRHQVLRRLYIESYKHPIYMKLIAYDYPLFSYRQ
ncbi:hypothetical protein [Aureibacter tunicatorum]|uniref:Uncharacterized protein n=1 Tax=Aureibacter tunicatorum TaxID=866807 RepID=A0AAE4BTS2_9BACT|nr:hypothetical protein [Aureibacter tunicatorum]MDR6240088.1 hypothetical protein [Aureibacter tunicatorum]BDD04559.1 hypothetical protein AUTU_20420 [Aureibacter tunicatorum]